MAKEDAPKKVIEVKNPLVSIATSLGGMMVAIVAITMLWGDEYKWVAVPICFAISLLGIVLGYFASRK